MGNDVYYSYYSVCVALLFAYSFIGSALSLQITLEVN